jgi:hypothetical protein
LISGGKSQDIPTITAIDDEFESMSPSTSVQGKGFVDGAKGGKGGGFDDFGKGSSGGRFNDGKGKDRFDGKGSFNDGKGRYDDDRESRESRESRGRFDDGKGGERFDDRRGGGRFDDGRGGGRFDDGRGGGRFDDGRGGRRFDDGRGEGRFDDGKGGGRYDGKGGGGDDRKGRFDDGKGGGGKGGGGGGQDMSEYERFASAMRNDKNFREPPSRESDRDDGADRQRKRGRFEQAPPPSGLAPQDEGLRKAMEAAQEAAKRLNAKLGAGSNGRDGEMSRISDASVGGGGGGGQREVPAWRLPSSLKPAPAERANADRESSPRGRSSSGMASDAPAAAAPKAPQPLVMELYQKMKAIGLPPGAIKKKMLSDGVSSEEVEKGRVQSMIVSVEYRA